MHTLISYITYANAKTVKRNENFPLGIGHIIRRDVIFNTNIRLRATKGISYKHRFMSFKNKIFVTKERKKRKNDKNMYLATLKHVES